MKFIYYVIVANLSILNASLYAQKLQSMDKVEFKAQLVELKSSHFSLSINDYDKVMYVIDCFQLSPELLKDNQAHRELAELYLFTFNQTLPSDFENALERLDDLSSSLDSIPHSVLNLGLSQNLDTNLVLLYGRALLSSLKIINNKRTPDYTIKVNNRVLVKGIFAYETLTAERKAWLLARKTIEEKWSDSSYIEIYEQYDRENYKEEMLEQTVKRIAGDLRDLLSVQQQFSEEVQRVTKKRFEQEKMKLLKEVEKELIRFSDYDYLPMADPHEKEKAKDRLELDMLRDAINKTESVESRDQIN